MPVAPFPTSGRQQARGGDIRKPVKKPKRVPGKGYVDLGDGRFRNVKAGNPRKGKTFRIKDGAHVYRGGQRIGGKPKAARPQVKPRPKAAPFDPTQPLTGKAFGREVDALTRLQYAPQFREIDRLTNESVSHERGMGDWYTNTYIPELERAAQRQQEAYQGAQTSLQQAATGMAQMDTQRQAQMRQQAEASAKARGGQVDEKVYAEMAQGTANRQADANAQAGLLGTLGASRSAYAAQQPVLGRMQEADFRRRESDRRRELDRTRGDLTRERAAFKVKARGDLATREHTKRLENEVFGLDTLKAKLDAQGEAADRRLARAKLREDRRRDRRDFAADRDDEAFDRQDALADNQRAGRKDGSPGGLTATQKRAYQQDFASAYSLFNNPKNRKKASKNPSAAIDDLVANDKIPRDLAKAAVQRATKGGVDPALARQIKRKYGVTVKARSKSKNLKTVAGVPIIGGRPTP